jgi:hypothetical protein
MSSSRSSASGSSEAGLGFYFCLFLNFLNYKVSFTLSLLFLNNKQFYFILCILKLFLTNKIISLLFLN